MDAETGRIRSVLHVLPHPGGGGETYVDALALMDGYRFERVYLAEAPGTTARSARLAILRRGLAVARGAHRHDLLHAHGEFASAICFPGLAAGRSIVTLHGLHVLRRTSGVAHLLANANLRLIVRASTRTICVSQAEYDDVLEAVGSRVERSLRLVLNGVDLALPRPEERAAARAEFGLAPSTVVGVYVGGLDEHKDPIVPVRAVLEVARSGGPIALLVAGDGPLRPELERLAAEPGGEAVHVLGHRLDVRQVLAAGDFFVLPSQREGLSFALLEAMSLGLVPIVSDAPGNPEAVGDAGFVVPRGDVEGFAAAFSGLFVNEATRLALGNQAHERVALHFRADEMVEKTRKVYDEVMAVRRGR